jgi:hypothetical protein
LVLVVGSWCTILRSPHSAAAAAPRETVRQSERSTEGPGFTVAVAITGAWAPAATTGTEYEPASLIPVFEAVRVSVPLPTAPTE